MKLLNRCKKYRDKSVQLTITSIIISHTHAPLQLCIVAPLLWSPSVSLQIVICSDNTELKWCMGVANNYACYRQLYRLVPVLFIPVQQFHPTCSYTFYTCSTLYLFKFLGKIFICLVSLLFYCPLD